MLFFVLFIFLLLVFVRSHSQTLGKQQHDSGTSLRDGASDSKESKEYSSDSDETESYRSNELKFEKKSFSRRQIVSNWDKYDLPDVHNETCEIKGDDFSKLVESAGAAVAQFRFKDEIVWDEDDGLDGVVSLDCQGLSADMDCIPLYRRLGLEDDNVFSESQIILQDLVAKEHIGNCTSSAESSKIIERPLDTTAGARHNAHCGDLNLANLAKTSSSVSLDFGSTTASAIVVPSAMVVPSEMVVPSAEVSQSGTITPSATLTDTAHDNLDTDLDFLLSLDSPTTNTDKHSLQESQSRPACLNQPQASSEAKDVITTPNSSSDSPLIKKEDNLEDWLDSVLGD